MRTLLLVIATTVVLAGCSDITPTPAAETPAPIAPATAPAAPACDNPESWDYGGNGTTPGDYIERCEDYITSDGYGEGRYGCATPDDRCMTIEEAELEAERISEEQAREMSETEETHSYTDCSEPIMWADPAEYEEQCG